MEKWFKKRGAFGQSIAICLCASVLLTSCTQPGDTSPSSQPEGSQKQDVVLDTSPSTEADESPLVSSSELSEYEVNRQEYLDSLHLPPRGSYEPSEIFDWQEDPTLQYDKAPQWDHVEFRAFGSPDQFILQEKTIVEYTLGGSLVPDSEEIVISYLLPPNCYDYSVLNFDAGFSGGAIKFGEFPSFYARIPAGEDGFHLEEGNFHRDNLTSMWQHKQAEVETQDNVPGGIYETQRFIRGIVDYAENHIVAYFIKLDDTRLVYLYFYVSEQATAQDLELYDAIAESVQIKV